ncbi:hypothetical protein Lepto782_23825 (plasmid) [Leptospira interrogans serovar Canicola]|uniref:Uncharacterized protein n=1 Tax=Leptospira interrogans serovar Canicola TaxID=211880 RepID=A0AAP9WFL8_LEPIR|nr:hypothetical protein Lepto782_23825 [Leptospira interrogans serovar Canicola]
MTGHNQDYRKLIVVSFKKNILETLNVSSPKDLHGTAFENHLSVLLNCTTALFSNLLGLIDSRAL